MEVPMKKHINRVLAIILSLALLTAQTAHASMAIGTELMERDVALADGVMLTANSLWSASKGDLRTEHYITYTPGGDVTAMVYSGTYAASLNTVPAAAAALEALGYRVVAAVNGGFFNTDGTIVGMLVTEGVLRSADLANFTMVGIKADGSFFVDDSTLTKTAGWQLADGSEYTAGIIGYNAYRTSAYKGRLFLYNNDFSSRVTSGGPNVSVLLQPAEGEYMTMNGTMTMTVLSVSDCTGEDAVFNGVIPDGCYMLYAEAGAASTLWADLLELQEGQQVTISVSGASEEWTDAVYGISALETLVRDGQVMTTDNTAAPRTVLGLKDDGTVVLYTIDGRQSGYSVGASYTQAAQRLIELGCTTVVALDGGGSTTLGATLPGSDSFSVLNRPSNGISRRINNTILLVAPAGPTGEFAGYYVDGDRLVLAGSSLSLTAVPYDTAGYALSGLAPVWSAGGGSITEDGSAAVYTAGAAAGLYQVTAAGSGLQGTLPIRIVDQLFTLTVSREGGSGIGSLVLAPGETAELTAAGTWYNLPVSFADTDVQWSIEGPIGAIDDLGTFTAVNDNAGGSILAAAGGLTVRIPVTVDRGDPFTDMGGSWATEYVTQLYQMGLTTGIQQPDGSYIFDPGRELTRGELLVFLTRLLGVDTSLYSGVELPFADTDSIPEWALPSVQAMYELQVLEGTYTDGVLTAGFHDPVTRESAMTMMGRVLTGSDSCDLSVFTDGDAVSGWASAYVQTLVARGVVQGSGGYLSPSANIDRASAAKLLVLINGMEKAELTPRSAAAAEEETEQEQEQEQEQGQEQEQETEQGQETEQEPSVLP